MKLAAVALTLGLLGCAGEVKNVVSTGIQNGAAAIDSPLTKKELDDAAASLTKSARDVALDDETQKRIDTIVDDVLSRLGLSIDFSLRKLQALIDNLPAETRPIVRAALDEAFATRTQEELDATRETLVGKKLQDDIAAAAPAIDIIVKQAVASALEEAHAKASAEVAADVAEASKWKWLAIGLTCLVAILLALHAHAVHILRGIIKR